MSTKRKAKRRRKPEASADAAPAAKPAPREDVDALLRKRDRLVADLNEFRRVMDPEEARDAQDHIAEIDRLLESCGYVGPRRAQTLSAPSAESKPRYRPAPPVPQVAPRRDQDTSPKAARPPRAPQARVLVDMAARRYHATMNCKQSRNATKLCDAVGAYFSPLRPCSMCALPLHAALQKTFGAATEGRRGIPPLTPLRGRERTPGRRPRRKARSKRRGTIPYGEPVAADDVRFTHYSRLEMGTARYRQNADEFLAEPTDDDHDWRGGTSMME